MRAVIIADIHAHPHRVCSRNGGLDRLEDCLSAVRQSLQLAQEWGEAYWVFCGDIKQVRGQWPQLALSGMLELMEEFGDVRKVMLAGNGGHDGVDVKGNGATGLRPFVPYAEVVGTPRVLTLGFGKEKLPVAMWPWAATYEALPPFLRHAAKQGCRVLCAHAYLSGAAIGKMELRLPGVGATLEQFGLGGKAPVFDFGFFGDIHKTQVLGPSPDDDEVPDGWHRMVSGQAFYPGSPYAQNWGEQEEHKGVILTEISQDKTGHIEGWWQFSPLESPRFIERVIDKEQSWEHVRKEAQKGVYEGHFVKLWFDGFHPGKDLRKLEEQCKARHFETHRKGGQPTQAARTTLHAGMAPKEVLTTYVKARPPQDISAKTALEAGMRLWG